MTTSLQQPSGLANLPDVGGGLGFQADSPSITTVMPQEPKEKFIQALKYFIPSAIVGFGDTLTEPFVGEDTLKKKLQESYPEFINYYGSEAGEGARAVGDLVGMFVPGMIAAKSVRATSFLGRMAGADKSPFLRSVFASGKSYDELLAPVRARDLYLAERGALGTVDLERNALARGARLTRGVDNIKESIAFELGVAGTMHSSDTLFPDEMSLVDHLILGVPFAVGMVGVEQLYLRRLLRQSVQDASKFNLASLNGTEELGLDNITFRSGNRDGGATLYEIHRQGLQGKFDETTDPLYRSQLNKTILGYKNATKQQIEKMANDSPIEGFTTRIKLEPSEYQGIANGLAESPFALLGTYSIQKLPDTRAAIDDLLAKQAAKVEALDKKIGDLSDFIGVNSGIKNVDKEIAQLKEAQKERELVNGTGFFVQEANGEQALLRERKPIFQDGSRYITSTPETAATDKTYVAKFHHPGKDEPDTIIAVTDTFLPIIPTATFQRLQENVIINNVNVTRSFKSTEFREMAGDAKLLLQDMGIDWHYKNGQRGREIFQNLPNEISREIDRWVESSSMSKLRNWRDQGDPRFQQLYEAYEPVRMRLRELAAQDGTIPLFRGESLQEHTKIARGEINKVNDVVSMTSNPRVAQGFAQEHMISKRVHVDDIVMIVGGSGNEWEFIVKNNRQRVVAGVEEDLRPLTSQVYEGLTLYQRSAQYALSQKAIDNWKPKDFTFSINDHHTRLDAIATLLERRPEAIGNITMPPGMTNVEDIIFRSVAGKYTEYARLREFQKQFADPTFIRPADVSLTTEDIRKMLNLPGGINGQPSPLVDMFEFLYRDGVESFDAFGIKSLKDVRSLVKQYYDIGKKGIELDPNDIKFMGEMLNIPENAKPSLLLKRPPSPDFMQRENIIAQNAQNQARVSAILHSDEAQQAPVISAIMKELDNARYTQVAKQVGTLQEGTQRLSPYIATQSFAAGDNPALQATYQAMSITDRISRNIIGDIFATTHDTFNSIRAPGKEADFTSFMTFRTARGQGWDIKGVEVNPNTGNYRFLIDRSKHNQEIWQRVFSRDMPTTNQPLYMPGMTDRLPNGTREYKPLEITKLAHETALAFSSLGQQALAESNVLRKAAGLGPLPVKSYWLPPENLARQEKIYILSKDGQEKVEYIAHGRTYQEAKADADRYIRERPDTFAVDQTDLQRYFHIQDEAFSRVMDFSDPFAQTGRAKGKSVSELTNVSPSVIGDMVGSIRQQYESVIRRTRALYFEPQLNYVNQMQVLADPEKAKKGQTIWQTYKNFIYGNQTLNPNTNLGDAYNTAERVYDRMLRYVYDKRHAIEGERTVNDKERKIFEQLDKEIGSHNPFTDAVDYVARTYKADAPPSAKQHMAALNNLTSLFTLRLMELGHPLLNFISLASTMPAVIKGMVRASHETPEQFAARIGAYGNVVDDKIGSFSATRAIVSGIHDMFTTSGREELARAAKKGLLDQDVAEIARTMTAPAEGYAAGLFRKYTDFLSKPSDWSEKMSRAIAFSVGSGIAKRIHGIEGEENIFAFAHKFANDVIGDYNPLNRPQIFQGAAGMPLGLFMTFQWNYFQRLFNYIENKNIRAFATQYAMQSALFGASSVPGFKEFTEFFASNYDGSVNPVDGFRNRFGDGFADLVLYGSISNLPKLVADDGIAVFTRGDVQARIPGFQLPASLELVNRFYQTTRETAESLRTVGGLSTQHLAEIFANYSMNRPLRGMIELGLGYDVDKRGQMINSDVRTGIGIAARIVGMRTQDEEKALQIHAKVREQDLAQRERVGWLRDKTRAQLRAGEFGIEQVEDNVREYMRTGGSPRGYARWLAENALAAMTDKNTRLLMDGIKDPTQGRNVRRLMSLHSKPRDDPEFED